MFPQVFAGPQFKARGIAAFPGNAVFAHHGNVSLFCRRTATQPNAGQGGATPAAQQQHGAVATAIASADSEAAPL